MTGVSHVCPPQSSKAYVLPAKSRTLRLFALCITVLELVGIVICLCTPSWLRIKYAPGDEASSGLFILCANNGTCHRHADLNKGHFVLCMAMYMAATVCVLVSAVCAICATTRRQGVAYHSAAITLLSLISLGMQLATLAMFGDIFETHKLCVFRQFFGKPRTMCHAIDIGDTGENAADIATTLGWVYWLAVGVAFVTSFNTLVGYNIVNGDISFYSSKL